MHFNNDWEDHGLSHDYTLLRSSHDYWGSKWEFHISLNVVTNLSKGILVHCLLTIFMQTLTADRQTTWLNCCWYCSTFSHLRTFTRVPTPGLNSMSKRAYIPNKKIYQVQHCTTFLQTLQIYQEHCDLQFSSFNGLY